MTITERKAFTPNCVFIPDGEDGDPDACTLLMLDSDGINWGPVYTREAWEAGGAAEYERHGSEQWSRTDGEPIEGGRLELLPELWIIKIPEREYWIAPSVLEQTKRIFGVYVFDRKRHVHICSFEANYELTFLGSQFDMVDEKPSHEWDEDDQSRYEELADKISEGDRDNERVTYWGVRDIDRILENPCREGFLPESDAGGGFKLEGIVSVTYDKAIEETEECYRTNGEL